MSDQRYRQLKQQYEKEPTFENLKVLIAEENRVGVIFSVTPEQVMQVLHQHRSNDYGYFYDIDTIRYSPTPNGVEIKAYSMYRNPINCNYELLKSLAELFRTTAINVDDYNMGGCETCDWGSSYGHTFNIEHPNVDISLLIKEKDSK